MRFLGFFGFFFEILEIFSRIIKIYLKNLNKIFFQVICPSLTLHCLFFLQNHSAQTAEEKKIEDKLQKNEAQVEQLYRDWNNKWKETHKIMEVTKLWR